MLNTVGPELPSTTKFKSPNCSNYPLAVGIFFCWEFISELVQCDSVVSTHDCLAVEGWGVVLPLLSPHESCNGTPWPGFQHAKELHTCSFTPGHDWLFELRPELHKKSRCQITSMHCSGGVRIAIVPMENSPCLRKILFMCNIFTYRHRRYRYKHK